MLKCIACGTENPADFKFCENCGEKLDQIICSNCSHANLPDMKFCEECGQRLDIIKCSSCDHENPSDFKFCEECGHQLGLQVSNLSETEVPRPEDITPEIKPQSQRTVPEPAAVSEKQPQRVLQPASKQPEKAPLRSKPITPSESKRQPLPKPATRTSVKVSKRPRQSSKPTAEVAYKSRRRLESKKPSYLKTVVVPMITQAVCMICGQFCDGICGWQAGNVCIKSNLAVFCNQVKECPDE